MELVVNTVKGLYVSVEALLIIIILLQHLSVFSCAQMKTIILVFLNADALEDFRNSSNWEAGVDGSVAVVEFGAGKDLTTTSFDEPIVGFVINNKGLMYNLTLEGTKITKINK